MVNRSHSLPSRSRPDANMPLLMLLGAIGAYVLCASFWIGANPWEPLARELGWGVVLGGSLAVGLFIGRFKALLAVLVLIPVFVLSGVRDPLALLVAPVVLLIFAFAIALGGWRLSVGRPHPHRADAHRRRAACPTNQAQDFLRRGACSDSVRNRAGRHLRRIVVLVVGA
jgi:hypothetical protein